VILLDTNVLSVLMKPEPDPDVKAWLNRQPVESMWTTAITVFEVRIGIEIMETGRRRRSLEASFDRVLHDDLEDRIVSFDESAAQAAGRIGAARRRIGRPVEMRDLQIAGIAIARKATIATRNIRHFEDLGIDLIDPWSA
jgi:predicted nucleic acid-binding protein